ncbi:hypothetical protein HY633_03445 [Candidatus Uhrbacteria bacterium]|nr:hypothetical protein [Candidatus Uhrbacteria bacterium]
MSEGMPSGRAFKRTLNTIVIIAVSLLVGSVAGSMITRYLMTPAEEPAACDAESCDLLQPEGSTISPADGDAEITARLCAAEDGIVFRLGNPVSDENGAEYTGDAATHFAVADHAFWRTPGLRMFPASEEVSAQPPAEAAEITVWSPAQPPPPTNRP